MSNIGTTEFSGLCGSASLLIGVAIGPLFIAPLSERYGRKWTILTSFALFAILWLPVATATNVATVIAIRGVAGFVGSVGRFSFQNAICCY